MHPSGTKHVAFGVKSRAVCQCGYATSYYKRRSDAIDRVRVHQETRRLIAQREQV